MKWDVTAQRLRSERSQRDNCISISVWQRPANRSLRLLCTPSLLKQPDTALQTERLMMYELYRHVCQRQTDNRNRNLKTLLEMPRG